MFSVVLFGSVARSEAHCHSDIDLLIICDRLPEGHFKRTDLIIPVEEVLEKKLVSLRNKGIFTNFNYLVKTKDEARIARPLYFDLIEDCIYLYDKDDFFRKIMQGFRKRLKRLGSKRVKVGSVRYWELKPDIEQGEVFEI